MYDFAGTIASLYVKTRRYPVRPSRFCKSTSSIIFLIVFFKMSKSVREIFCTLKSFKLKLVFRENTE